MRRLLTMGVVGFTLGCAQGELAVDGPNQPLTCSIASDCGAGGTCSLGRCAEGCSTDADCLVGRCIREELGGLGRCDPSAPGAPNETIMSPGGTSVSPAPEPPDGDEPGPPQPAPEEEAAPEPNPPAAEPSPPPVEPPPVEPPPVDPPPAAPEPEPEPAPWPSPQPMSPCSYPESGDRIRLGSVMPRLSWPTAYGPDGTSFDFDLETFHCDPAYARYSIVVVVIGAEWCNACGQYLRELAAHAAGIEAAGGLLLYVETQDNQQNWLSSRRANQIVNGYVGAAPGIRVGDGETVQGAGRVYNAPIVSVLPTVFAVRRSDMMVLQDDAQDWAEVARREQGNGERPPQNPAPGPRPNECVEEGQEPNDQPAAAGQLPAGQEIVGGICDGSPDFYRIVHPGDWTLDLIFDHGAGDLDVYVWDPIEEDILFDAFGNPVGSDSTTSDEQFSLFGEQTIVVVGYEGALAPYRLHLNGH